jgi:hypothetical protein
MLDSRRRTAISLAIAASIFALAAGLAWYADDLYDQRVVREHELLRAEAEAQHSLRTARDQVELAERVSSRYRALEDAGVFSAIDKPAAIDQAESTLRPFAVAITRYQIGGGHEIAQSPLERSGQYQIEVQRVAVDFEPLHEERFLQVWEAIASLRGPLGGIENCEMHRAPQQNAQQHAALEQARRAAPEPLTARCLLTWYRLHGAAAPEPGAASARPAAGAKS